MFGKFRLFRNENRDLAERQNRAAWAGALVVDSRGGFPGEGAAQAIIRLTLEVTPAGGAPYRTSVSWLVDSTAMSYVAPGSRISVKVDLEDPKRIYPAEPWAKYLRN